MSQLLNGCVQSLPNNNLSLTIGPLNRGVKCLLFKHQGGFKV